MYEREWITMKVDPKSFSIYVDIVGTIITCEGGEDPFAFATILPLSICRVS